MEKYIITMLGEKDHGKSTLIGSLLIAAGAVTEHRINEAKKYSKDGGSSPATFSTALRRSAPRR